MVNGCRINVYNDGKLSRGVPGYILEETEGKLLISYTHWDDSERVEWFVPALDERDGSYESLGANYWYYPERETVEFAQEHKECFTEEYWQYLFGHIKPLLLRGV